MFIGKGTYSGGDDPPPKKKHQRNQKESKGKQERLRYCILFSYGNVPLFLASLAIYLRKAAKKGLFLVVSPIRRRGGRRTLFAASLIFFIIIYKYTMLFYSDVLLMTRDSSFYLFRLGFKRKINISTYLVAN